MQGLFKSTENHILAWLLHLQLKLHAPLFRFQKHLHLTWFQSFLLLSSFSRNFFFGNDTCAFWKCMCAPRGMESSLCTCSLKSRRCTCMPRGMVFEVRYLPTVEEKNQTKKKLKGKSFQWLLGKNSKRHNFTDTELNHVPQRGICSLKYK